jgi:hypothetical protein
LWRFFFFRYGLMNYLPDWLRTSILLIAASWVARIPPTSGGIANFNTELFTRSLFYYETFQTYLKNSIINPLYFITQKLKLSRFWQYFLYLLPSPPIFPL